LEEDQGHLNLVDQVPQRGVQHRNPQIVDEGNPNAMAVEPHIKATQVEAQVVRNPEKIILAEKEQVVSQVADQGGLCSEQDHSQNKVDQGINKDSGSNGSRWEG
jgi:hypothetical protein